MSYLPKYRSTNARDAAEAAFKTATTRPVVVTPKARSIPGAKEQVTLRIGRNILDFFQAAGPGWQDRMIEALRNAAGK